jgi:hypothetical protein
MKTTTARKPGRPAKVVTKGKPGRPAKAAKAVAKKAAATNARKPVDKSGLPLEERVARPGTKKDTLFKLLYKSKNKGVPVATVLKALYGKEADDNRGALNGVMLGVQLALEDERGLEFRKEGRGDEFTLGVYTK